MYSYDLVPAFCFLFILSLFPSSILLDLFDVDSLYYFSFPCIFCDIDSNAPCVLNPPFPEELRLHSSVDDNGSRSAHVNASSKLSESYSDSVFPSWRTCPSTLSDLHSSVVSKGFSGKMRSIFICSRCRTQDEVAEGFLDLSLAIRATDSTNNIDSSGSADSLSLSRGSRRNASLSSCFHSLEECIQHYLCMEDMVESTRFCSRCGTDTPYFRHSVLDSLPPILCIHLKV